MYVLKISNQVHFYILEYHSSEAFCHVKFTCAPYIQESELSERAAFISICSSFCCFCFYHFCLSSTHFFILRKLRWHSFQNSHRPSVTSASLEINRQSAAQLNLLQKFSLLRLTAILEKHTDTSKHGWNW